MDAALATLFSFLHYMEMIGGILPCSFATTSDLPNKLNQIDIEKDTNMLLAFSWLQILTQKNNNIWIALENILDDIGQFEQDMVCQWLLV